MGNELADSNFKEIVLWLLRLRRRFRVTGASMFPLLNPGDEVLVDVQAYGGQPPQVGDIVIAHHPTKSGLKIIKRVTAVPTPTMLQLQGDNRAESTDFEDMSLANVIGRVTSRFG
jgi:nickel-type superoxide dismutase maturation protease